MFSRLDPALLSLALARAGGMRTVDRAGRSGGGIYGGGGFAVEGEFVAKVWFVCVLGSTLYVPADGA